MNCVRKIIIAFLVFVCLVLASRVVCGPLLWQNLTDSGPHGIYIYAFDQSLQRGDWCVVDLPQDVPGLHVSKGYKLIKQVRAFNGETYEVDNEHLMVQAQSFPITRAQYLPQLPVGRYIVPANHYLFLNDSKISFDSRYIGPVNAGAVQCKVIFIIDYDKINRFWDEARSWFIWAL